MDCEANIVRSAQLAAVIATLDLSPSNLALALVFLEKYNSNAVTSLGPGSASYYTIISALVIANKYLNDQSYTLKTWQSVLNKYNLFNSLLPLLNQLETHFLAALNYSLTSKHDSRMWNRFKAFNAHHVQQLQQMISPNDIRVAPVASSPQSVLATPPLQAMQGVTPPDILQLHTPQYVATTSYRQMPATPMSLDFVPATFLPTPLMQVWLPGCKRRRIMINESFGAKPHEVR